MTLNKTAIEWTDYTWNPVTGCKHGCDYCYARRIAERFKGGKAFPNGFEPTFHPERLRDFRKTVMITPSVGVAKYHKVKVFVCSMADLFGDWVPPEWIEKVIEVTHENPTVTFQFLTKNPSRYGEFSFPSNCWLGTTVEGPEQVDRIAQIQHEVGEENILFVSFEPLLGNVLKGTYEKFRWQVDDIDWIIIGAMTGMRAKQFQPKKEWADNLIWAARGAGTPIFLKSNLNWPEKIQEYPKVP